MFLDLLNKVVDQHANKLPFVIYRKPNEETVRAIFQNDTQLHLATNFNESGFVFAPFDDQKSTLLIPENDRIEAEYKVKKANKTNEVDAFRNDDVAKQAYLDKVSKAIKEIQSGSFKKVVLSRLLTVDCKTKPVDLFLKILDYYSTAFCYLWYHPKVGAWLGATPEILLKTDNFRITSMSLAGTQKQIQNMHPVWGSKEVEEQQLVTDYIFNTLNNLVFNLNVLEKKSVKAGNLWHLRTKLTGTFITDNFAKIVKALHPTPAVCGLPLERTKKFILENEGYNRSFYTGYLGELNLKEKKQRSSNKRNQEQQAYSVLKNTSTLFVNLRCMQLMHDHAHIYIGGGITESSDPNKEWQETVSKSATMLQILNSI